MIGSGNRYRLYKLLKNTVVCRSINVGNSETFALDPEFATQILKCALKKTYKNPHCQQNYLYH